MEKATSIEEIRSLICSCLEPWGAAGRENLISAALISHAWTDSALNVLWGNVFSPGKFSHLIEMLGDMRKGWKKEVS